MKTLANIILLLENTIEQKKRYLEQQHQNLRAASFAEEIVINATIGFLEANIGELTRILDDLKSVKEQ